MSGLDSFFKENVESFNDEKEVLISNRLPKFKLKPISAREREKIKSKYLKNRHYTDGSVVMEGNMGAFNAEIQIKSIVEPDLYNAALQDSYHVMDEFALLENMLSEDEHKVLEREVGELYTEKSVDEMMEEVKN